jgi:hypothetical protein
MDWDGDINKVFLQADNNIFAKKFASKLKSKCPGAKSKASKVPDFRLKINNRVFLCMQKTCATHFYLEKDKDYPFIKIIKGSGHTHAIAGNEIKSLSEANLEIIAGYVMQAYYKYK